MSVKEKLVELLEPYANDLACEQQSGSCELTSCRSCNARNLADHLIANGITVQECVEKGCDICNGIKPLLLETDIGYTWIVKGKMENAYGDCKIRYCPMCGRELPEPPKGE